MMTARRLRFITGALALSIAATGCGNDAKPAQSSTSVASTSAAATASPAPVAPPPPLSDDDQIRQTLTAFSDAFNTQNWDAYKQLVCPKMAEQFNGPAMELLKKTRATNGLSQLISVNSIAINGANATATMDVQSEVLGRQTAPIKLARDDDGWKVCMVA